jgi:hypothetical protein
MVRFSTKTLLFLFVLIALWCSTFSGYAAGRDVRASVLLILFITVGYAAVYSRGMSRAFWSGFFAVMLITGGSVFGIQLEKYVPNFLWETMTYQYPTPIPAPPPVVSPYMPQVVTSPGQPVVRQPYVTPVPPQAVFVPTVANRDERRQAIHDSIATLWTLVLASIVGAIGAVIYGSRAKD